MPTTFQRFAASATNILNDTDYASNTARTNGVQAGMASSALHNKVFLQTSTMTAAIADVMSDLGETVNDSNFSNLKSSIKKTFGAVGSVTSRSSGFTLTASDRNSVNICSGTFTAAVTAAATLTSGWAAYFRVESGNVTIDPNGSEQVNGVTTIVAGPGSEFWLVCDGTGFKTLGLVRYVSSNQTITSSGALTLAHGLGRIPRTVNLILKCLTAEQGFSIGDEIIMPSEQAYGAGIYGTTVRRTASNILVRFAAGTNVFVCRKESATLGDIANLTNSSWALIVEAF